MKCVKKVERIQERALRAVYRDRTESYENLLKRAKLPTLLNRRLQDIAALVYKVKNDLLPSRITDIFSIKGSNYSLKNSEFITFRRLMQKNMGNTQNLCFCTLLRFVL